MPIDPKMMHSAVRIIGDVPDDRLVMGRRRGPIGTGFFVTVPSEADRTVRYGYVLTAHHVIEDESLIEIQAPNPFGNGELYEPVAVTGWRQPLSDVDLALAPFGGGDRAHQALKAESQILPHGTMPALGADIHYIGILTPLDRSMARTGTIGALDQQGIAHKGGYTYSAHLVDCRSYGGFSGSPCFLELKYAGLTPTSDSLAPTPTDWEPVPMGDIQYFVTLCGMFTEHLEDNPPGEVATRYGVGVMLPSDAIWEALMSDEVRSERTEQDTRLKNESPGGPQLENASVGSPRLDDEFARFEDLTRKLVHTPKSEVDEKRKETQTESDS
jgi:hypothetical protein